MTGRRSFLLSLGVGVLAAPPLALAQSAKVAHIGFLYFGSRESSLDTGRYQAFVEGMRELGYVDGKNLVIEARFADANAERISVLVGELLRLKVEVIVATGTVVTRVLQYSTTIPVVTTVAADPVGDGYAASLARPGSNITGLTITAADLGPKLLELVKAATPRVARAGVMVHPENPAHPLQLKRIMSAARTMGIQIVLAEAATRADIEREMAVLRKEGTQAVIILAEGFFVQEARAIAIQALKHRLATIGAVQGFAAAGGLMSYGANLVDNFRRAATYVDKILKGAKPGELPFEQPTRYSFVINLKTAKALGLTIPPALLRQAEDIIQ